MKYVMFNDPFPKLFHSDNKPMFNLNARIGSVGHDKIVFINDRKFPGNIITDAINKTIHSVPIIRQFEDPAKMLDHYMRFYDACSDVSKIRVWDHDYVRNNMYFKFIPTSVTFYNNMMACRETFKVSIEEELGKLAFEIKKLEQVTLFDLIKS